MKPAHPVNKNRPRVKICGITNLVDAEEAVQCGADALGFVFHKASPRYISPADAGAIVKRLPPFVNMAGVFVNVAPREALETARIALIDTVQFHGDEAPDSCMEVMESGYKVLKAVRVKDRESLHALSGYSFVNGILLDSYSREVYGGSGEKFDWTLAREAGKFGRIILAGGLNPGNVAEAIREAEPYGVDVSSGVEKSPGIKDHGKLRDFFEAI
ncbi:MAG: phosphoribosylanthranilate isomerase [Nitrospinae bacterium]|nr:phosphoribosylanthranilate isomerase [Nitrospinota bacterium]